MKLTDIEEIKSEIDGLIAADIDDIGNLALQLRECQTEEDVTSIKQKLLSKKTNLYAHKYHCSNDVEQELSKQEITSINSALAEVYKYHEARLKAVRSQCNDLIILADSLIQRGGLDKAGKQATAHKPTKRNTEATYTALRDFIIAKDADRIISGIHKVLKTAKGKEMAKVLVYLQNNNFINVPDRQKTHIIRLLFKELNRAYSDNDRKAISKYFSPAYFKTTYEDDFRRLDAIFK